MAQFLPGANTRATWETQSAIQHPPLANYVGQANITSGPQQMNNGSARGENHKPQNELLEKQDGSDWLDTGKASQTGRGNQAMAAVEAINRAKNA